MDNLHKLFLLLLVSCCIACSGLRTISMKQRADKLSEEKEYEKAIAAYWEHIKHREAVKEKPSWENPYIYLLDIGDTYLEMGDADKALETYELAATHNVKAGYVNDRLRNIATWYEEQGELEKAIKHLQEYRERDELLFDLMLNRLARKLVAEEEKAAEEGSQIKESEHNSSTQTTSDPAMQQPRKGVATKF